MGNGQGCSTSFLHSIPAQAHLQTLQPVTTWRRLPAPCLGSQSQPSLPVILRLLECQNTLQHPPPPRLEGELATHTPLTCTAGSLFLQSTSPIFSPPPRILFWMFPNWGNWVCTSDEQVSREKRSVLPLNTKIQGSGRRSSREEICKGNKLKENERKSG